MAYDKMFVTLRILDAYGRTKSKRVGLVATDAALGETAATAVVVAYDTVMTGHIISSIVSGQDNHAGSPGAQSNVDTGVTMSCQLAGRPDRAPLKWPTPANGYLEPDGTVDLNDAGIQALEALYVTATPAIATLSDGETIDNFVSGKLDK